MECTCGHIKDECFEVNLKRKVKYEWICELYIWKVELFLSWSFSWICWEMTKWSFNLYSKALIHGQRLDFLAGDKIRKFFWVKLGCSFYNCFLFNVTSYRSVNDNMQMNSFVMNWFLFACICFEFLFYVFLVKLRG